MQRNFLRGLLICLVPTVLFGAAAVFGTYRKGIDLAGGTILVYEVDLTRTWRKKRPGPSTDKKAAPPREGRGTVQRGDAQTRRVAEEADRPGRHPQRHHPPGRRVADRNPAVPFTPTAKKAAGTEDFVQEVKDLVSRVGVLEFRILANDTDDKEAFDEALELANNQYPAEQAEKDAKFGEPPPAPRRTDYRVSINGTDANNVKYEWVELGKEERELAVGLSNANAAGEARAACGGNSPPSGARPCRTAAATNAASGLVPAAYSRPFKKDNPAKDEIGKEVEYLRPDAGVRPGSGEGRRRRHAERLPGQRQSNLDWIRRLPVQRGRADRSSAR